jgi:hypothetical protein
MRRHLIADRIVVDDELLTDRCAFAIEASSGDSLTIAVLTGALPHDGEPSVTGRDDGGRVLLAGRVLVHLEDGTEWNLRTHGRCHGARQSCGNEGPADVKSAARGAEPAEMAHGKRANTAASAASNESPRS